MKRDMGFNVVNTGIVAIITVFLMIGQPVFGLSIATLILIVNYSSSIMSELWNVNNIFKGINRVFGDAYEMTEILGNQVPILTIPVKPGRNLAVIIEVAAMNNRQRKMGYNAARELFQLLGLELPEEADTGIKTIPF